MQKRSIGIALATLALAAAATFAIGTRQQLASSRESSEAAWQELASIHAARARTARDALASAGPGLDPALAHRVRGKLALTLATPADPGVLEDPVSINAYKQQQGELTGALFMLVAGDAVRPGPMEKLRAQLPRDEAALAQARVRYRQASAEYNALTATPLASLLGYRALVDAL